MFGFDSLNNVLPPIKSKESFVERSKIANWRPVKPLGSKQLTSSLTSSLAERKTIINSTSLPTYIGSEPNNTNIIAISDADLVLSRSARGETPTILSRVCIPCTGNSRRRRRRSPAPASLYEHIYEIRNLMADIRMNVFMSTSNKIHHKILNCNESLALVHDKLLTEDISFDGYSHLNRFSFIAMRDAVVLLSESDSVEEFVFEPGPIGLELTVQNNRIVCSAVMEYSQAYSLYGEVMVGLEILSINNIHVSDLQSFKEVVNMHQSSEISIIAVRRQEKTEFSESMQKLLTLIQPEENAEANKKSFSEYHHSEHHFEKLRDTVDDETTLFAPLAVKTTNTVYVNERNADEDDGSSNGWNFQTHVNISNNAKQYMQLISNPYKALPVGEMLCSPSGSLDNNFQIFHQSSTWKVTLYWIDKSGILHYRTEIPSGTSHVELINSSYMWLIAANRINRTIHANGVDDSHEYGMLLNMKSYQIASFTPVEDFTWSPWGTFSRYSHLKRIPSTSGEKAKARVIIQQVIRIID